MSDNIPSVQESPSPKSTRLIIAIDFGTTYTSVAYIKTSVTRWSEQDSLESFRHKAQVVREWPGSPSERNEFETCLIYNKNKPEESAFGYHQVEQLKRSLSKKERSSLSPVIRHFKLSLHHSRDTQDERDHLERIGNDINPQKSPIDFVRDFLYKLRCHLLDGRGSFFQVHFPDMTDDWKPEWVIGVPAAWLNPHEQQRYVDAAREAGILAPCLVSEAEATATAFLADKYDELECGQNFVVCDTGGSTADIAVITITSLDPLRVGMLSVGESVLCGAIYLSKAFRRLAARRLTESNIAVGKSEKLYRILDDLERDFNEYPKISFPAEGSLNDRVPLQTTELDDEQFVFTRGELLEHVFNPVFSQIADGVEEQVRSSQALANRDEPKGNNEAKSLIFKSLILAGGMSKNRYFQRFLRSRFEVTSAPYGKIKVGRPIDSVETAVARGCALMAVDQNGFVNQRRSRFSYGVITVMEYGEDGCEVFGPRAQVKPKRYKHEDGEFVEVVDWFISKNEPIPQGIMMQEKPRYQTAGKSHSFKFADEVIVSNMESWDEARTLVTSQRYKSSERRTFKMRFDLSQISKESFEYCEEFPLSKSYYKIEYKIGLVLENNTMKWYAFTETPGGEETRTECILDFESVKSHFTSLGTVRSAWSHKSTVGPPNTAQSESRSKRRQRDHDDSREPLRKSLRLMGKRENVVPGPEIPESPDPLQDETYNEQHSGEEVQEAQTDFSRSHTLASEAQEDRGNASRPHMLVSVARLAREFSFTGGPWQDGREMSIIYSDDDEEEAQPQM